METSHLKRVNFMDGKQTSSMSIALPLSQGGCAPRVVVKDNFAIAGHPVSMGSARFAQGRPSSENAEVVDRLLAAGAKLVGRAKMHELAYGVTGKNDWAGTPLNPNWPDRIVGGSSSGCAAAVAEGFADIAIGTDTGGSIRMPAACCGIVGLKPSFGLVSRKGVLPECSTLDCVGPMARDVAGVEWAMAALCDGFTAQKMPGRVRLGLLEQEVDADIAAAFQHVITALDAESMPVSLAHLDDAFSAGITIIGAEMWSEFSSLAPEFEGIGADIALRLQRAASVSARQVEKAEAVRRSFTAELDTLLGQVDFLLLPTLPCVPPLLADAEDPLAQLRLTGLVRPFNLSGHPALTIPMLTEAGLPAAVQLIGRLGQDAAVCAYGRQIEKTINRLTEKHL